MNNPVLYLIPSPLGNTPPSLVLPAGHIETIRTIQCFAVEELRTARRFLSALGLHVESLELELLNEHTSPEEMESLLAPLREGRSMGMISEAGLPAVADPGAELIALAHRNGFNVAPLVGPSSLMLALMASGLNGQKFAFQGYLPVKSALRDKKIRELEKLSGREHQTQIFIETPYRNESLYRALLSCCAPGTRLTIAINLTMPDAFISTRTIGEWKQFRPGSDGLFRKKPCVFLILA
ncbi:MAG: SAM-dependent methyltransferase [Bacteroidales bacterium]|jgi:16S rRNA (cytidine1402-2'-O)-methyltransferase|nr:SAM-dependent methyltransferase [Bacteroidales bacterium]MDD2263762.1 SAM-dependent methyltransferase [Bacteroidales bacterium]MDD2831020.1 SAM-dependent methyltransferase [Bacteroidales bacterium]MDD3208172.1 SAM-dependent methyltransferase [Bacteroidales bacterium]MDD3696786.1 SAM-dependent methyltransferase [Bacteroidales bacterium]